MYITVYVSELWKVGFSHCRGCLSVHGGELKVVILISDNL